MGDGGDARASLRVEDSRRRVRVGLPCIVVHRKRSGWWPGVSRGLGAMHVHRLGRRIPGVGSRGWVCRASWLTANDRVRGPGSAAGGRSDARASLGVGGPVGLGCFSIAADRRGWVCRTKWFSRGKFGLVVPGPAAGDGCDARASLGVEDSRRWVRVVKPCKVVFARKVRVGGPGTSCGRRKRCTYIVWGGEFPALGEGGYAVHSGSQETFGLGPGVSRGRRKRCTCIAWSGESLALHR
ncbi:hypothetical protein CUTER_01800 [Corynebacterium uterequi]|uniref:Uncharacterized protein n=1 Tax=Corynebacterium uterequi TaxID=1072256 RepID=A0A0G3HAH8_9CORY|nr:hypothetical protein CUTER_01800 [Corynebacterium uterequi]